MSKATQTTIEADGLRYRSKVGGTPFASQGSYNSQMSCFKCGTHRNRSMLKAAKLVGRTQFVCAPSCKVLADMDAGVVA